MSQELRAQRASSGLRGPESRAPPHPGPRCLQHPESGGCGRQVRINHAVSWAPPGPGRVTFPAPPIDAVSKTNMNYAS